MGRFRVSEQKVFKKANLDYFGYLTLKLSKKATQLSYILAAMPKIKETKK